MRATRLLATPLLLRPLAHVPFALLWGGLATSAIGDQLFTVVLSWIAAGVLGSGAGYLVSLQAGATLAAALVIGRWADRHDERIVMAAADLGRAAVLATMITAWLAYGSPGKWTLFASVLALAIGQALFRPALQSALPGLLDDHALLPAGNALIDTTERLARLLGPGLLALFASLLPLVHFVTVDVATFMLSAAAILTIIRLRPSPRRSSARRETIAMTLTRGFAAVRRHRVLWYTLMSTGGLNGAWYTVYFVGLPLFMQRAGVVGPGGSGLAAYGLVISAYGSTNLLSTLVVGSRGIARRPARLIFGGNALHAAGTLLMGSCALLLPASALLPCFCLSAACSAIGGPMQDITVATLRQTRLPREDLAAVVRSWIVMTNAGTLVALAIAPTLFRSVGIAATFLLCGAIVMAISLCGWARFAEPDGSP